MDQNLVKISWKEAATGGLWLGLALCGVSVLSYLGRMDESLSWMPTLLNFLLLVGFILFYGRRMSAWCGPQGYTFLQSFGFSLKMLMFAGVLAGLGQFILQTYIDPQYYRDLMANALSESGFTQAQLDLALEVTIDQRNPFLMIISGAMSMILYGGLLSLLIALFLKRPADPPTGDSPWETFPSDTTTSSEERSTTTQTDTDKPTDKPSDNSHGTSSNSNA